LIIAFMIPGRSQHMSFVKSWTMVVHYMAKNDITYHLIQKSGGDIYNIRNTLVSQDLPVPWEMMPVIKGQPYDYLMWIDSDIGGFTWDHIQKLIDADKDIITGIVPIGPTERSAVGQYGEDEYGQPVVQYFNLKVLDEQIKKGEIDANEPIEIGFCGYAFLLVKKGVFEAMEYPWFRYTPKEYAGRWGNMGEDIGWCERARETGFKVWMHPGVKLTHTKEITLNV